MALRAFGAHVLEDRLSAGMLASFETDVRYPIYHVLALLAVTWVVGPWQDSVLPAAAGWLFVAGTLLFSPGLYLLASTRVRSQGVIASLGGLDFVAGWLCLFVTAWRGSQRQNSNLVPSTSASRSRDIGGAGYVPVSVCTPEGRPPDNHHCVGSNVTHATVRSSSS